MTNTETTTRTETLCQCCKQWTTLTASRRCEFCDTVVRKTAKTRKA